MKILVCTETRAGQLDAVSLELLGAARSVASAGDDVVALVVGSDVQQAAAALGAADRIVAAIDPKLAVPTAEAYASLLHEVVAAQAPDLVLIAYSATGLDVAGDVATRAKRPLVAYVIGLARKGAGLTAVSQVYGGKIVATTEIEGPSILMVNPGAFAEAVPAPAAPDRIISLNSTSALQHLKVELVGEDLPNLADVDLATADRIVCVGRGIGDAEGVAQASELASLLSAEIAGSRPVVDNGWLPKLRQVGKSGRKVKPKLYLALGVSGAPEHLEGMGRSDLIIAVNTDAKAPIFGAAHYGATCDLFDLVTALTERLQAETA